MPEHTHRRRLRKHRPGPVAVLLAAALLASCARPIPKPLPVEAPPPPPAPPPARAAVHAAWAFQARRNACLASAAASRTRLEIAVRRDGPIRLTVSLPIDAAGKPVAHFHGPAGNWAVIGRHAGNRQIVFDLGHDMNSLSRLLMVLSGGVLDLQSPGKDLPVITLAPSGAEGQRWFACAQGIVI